MKKLEVTESPCARLRRLPRRTRVSPSFRGRLGGQLRLRLYTKLAGWLRDG